MSVEASRSCFLIDSLLMKNSKEEHLEPKEELMEFLEPKEELLDTEEEDEEEEEEEEELSSSEVTSENDMETESASSSGSIPTMVPPKADLSALFKMFSNLDFTKFAPLKRNGPPPMLLRPDCLLPFDVQKQLHMVQQTFQMNMLQNLGHTLPLPFVPPLLKHVAPPPKRVHSKRTSYVDQTLKGNLKKYRCDVCDKTFSRSNTLITHKRIHTGEKPFKCEHCGRAFRQPGNLTRHRLTHTTVKPYVCGLCDKAFNRASNLHTHMRTHSNI